MSLAPSPPDIKAEIRIFTFVSFNIFIIRTSSNVLNDNKQWIVNIIISVFVISGL